MVQPAATTGNPPIVVDLGKIRGKVVRRFKEQGTGKLADEIEHILAETRGRLGSEAAGKQLVPIVLVYRKKRRRRKRGGFFPF